MSGYVWQGSAQPDPGLCDCHGHRTTEGVCATFRELVEAGHSDPDIAERLGISSKTVIRRRQAAGLSSAWARDVQPCGTQAAYRRGCRCDRCKQAQAQAQAEYRATCKALSKPRARMAGLPWTEQELAVLRDRDQGTILERARKLGRSYEASRNRLRILQAQERSHG